MHDIEPYYHWRHLYTAEADPRSIFLVEPTVNLSSLKPFTIIISIRNGMNLVAKHCI